MDIEALINNMCRDKGITREQFDKEVEEGRKASIVGDLNNIGMVEGMQMQMIDQLGFMVAMLMDRIEELEAKVNA